MQNVQNVCHSVSLSRRELFSQSISNTLLINPSEKDGYTMTKATMRKSNHT